MSDNKTIAMATQSVPSGSDMIPVQRVGDNTARHVTVESLWQEGRTIKYLPDYFQVGDADYTAAWVRAIVDTPNGEAIYIPSGTFEMTTVELPRRLVTMVGDGDASIVRGKQPGYMFTWAAGESIVTACLSNLYFNNPILNGGIMYHQSSAEFCRLRLLMAGITANYKGGAIYAFRLDGLVGSNLDNIDIKGGSPTGGGGPGVAMLLTNCSTSHLWNVRMYSGLAGKGIYVEGGGTLYIHGSRLENGSRAGSPGYSFHNVVNFVLEYLDGEGSDDAPWLKLDGCHDVWIYCPIAPECEYSVNTNLIDILGCVNVNVYGGRIGNQHGLGGAGVGVSIDAASRFVKFQDVRFIGSFDDNFVNAGADVSVTGTQGGMTYNQPPNAVVAYP